MDFDSRFDCCKSCNSISFQCQNNKPPREIQGQGDCKYTERNRNVWMTQDKGNQNRTNRERRESKPNAGSGKHTPDRHCYCLSKQDFPQILKRESKQEKKDAGNEESCKYYWESSNGNWTSKSETLLMPEENKRNNPTNSDKLLSENILEFEEKVDFLFRIFKDYGQKFQLESYVTQSQAKSVEGFFKDVGHLLDFDKRLSAAEEGIEKLALIVEDLVKASSKNKVEENYSDPIDFDNMSVSQRINYLKNRNDWILNFMNAFLKPGLAEENYSKPALLPHDHKPIDANVDLEEKHRKNDQLGIIETLQKLRMRMTEIRQKKSQLFNEEQNTRNEKKGETAVKYARNKLEVISEQAELALSDESENDVEEKKNVFRIINENGKEEFNERDSSVRDVTFRILPQQGTEYGMKQSLDNFVFSKLNSSENKFLEGSNIKISLEEEGQDVDDADKYSSSNIFVPSSDINCLFCDNEKQEKPRDGIKRTAYIKPREFNLPIKKEKNSQEKVSCKQNGAKKVGDYEHSVQSDRKAFQDDRYLIFPRKGNRGASSVTELFSPTREESKKEVRRTEITQRPMTDPSCNRKTVTSPPTSLKPPLPDKCRARNSGINSVKNKNKILLSKKSCVRTS